VIIARRAKGHVDLLLGLLRWQDRGH